MTATPAMAAERSGAHACPLCGSESEPSLTTRDRNRRLSDDEFTYRRCRMCGTLFLETVPVDLERYYPQQYYDLPDPAELDRLAREGAHRVEIVSRFLQRGRLVEVGAGLGVFAYAARQAGFEVTALEMDARCCDYLRDVVGVDVVQTAEPEIVLRSLPPSRAVVMWHVLEHLPRPWECLASAAANLDPGGILVIATPNPAALQFRALGARWPHVDAPRHLQLIPADTLVGRAREHGLRPELLTSSDPGGLFWNRFGWQEALPGKLGSVLGGALALALRPVEGRGLRGSTYTVVFRKAAAP